MSTKENEIWMETNWENFDEALERGDITFCREVIAYVRDSGFDKDASLMSDKLKDIEVEKPGSFAVGMMLRFLKTKKAHYESQGLVPTLDLAIEDLEAIK